MQNRKFFLPVLMTVCCSLSLSAKTIAGGIDILENTDLGPNTIAVETSPIIIPYGEIHVSGSNKMFFLQASMYQKNYDTYYEPFIGAEYSYAHSDNNNLRQMDLKTGLRVALNENNIVSPFLDISQNYSFWSYKKGYGSTSTDSCPANLFQLGTKIIFGEMVGMEFLFSLKLYWQKDSPKAHQYIYTNGANVVSKFLYTFYAKI
jgi:hypothetical protein